MRTDVERLQISDTINMKTVKERLRYLKNSAESCKSIPKDFRGQYVLCVFVYVKMCVTENSLIHCNNYEEQRKL